MRVQRAALALVPTGIVRFEWVDDEPQGDDPGGVRRRVRDQLLEPPLLQSEPDAEDDIGVCDPRDVPCPGRDAVGIAAHGRQAEDLHALAADTDGIDGTEDNAGAVVASDTLTRAQALGLDAAAMLDDNDGYGFFEALGDLVMTGPTLTNVNDFRAMEILPGALE